MLEGEQHHTILLDTDGIADYRSVVGFFARQLLKELRLVGSYDVLYGKVKSFLRENLFDASSADAPVNLEAVSYTHLDVYKRQCARCVSPWRKRRSNTIS